MIDPIFLFIASIKEDAAKRYGPDSFVASTLEKLILNPQRNLALSKICKQRDELASATYEDIFDRLMLAFDQQHLDPHALGDGTKLIGSLGGIVKCIESVLQKDGSLHNGRSDPELNSLPEHDGLVFDERRHRVCVDLIWEDLDDEGTKMWAILWKAQGVWTYGPTISDNAARIKYRMPSRVKSEIESNQRRGYRLKRFIPTVKS